MGRRFYHTQWSKLFLAKSLALICVISQSVAFADALEGENSDAKVEKLESLHPFFAPFVAPASFLAPGAGHYFKNDKEAAAPLIKWHLAAFGTTLTTSVLYALSGASDALTPIALPLILMGGSGWWSLATVDFVGTFLDDPPPNRLHIRDKNFSTQVKLGALYLYDPLFQNHWYGRASGQVFWQSIGFRASLASNKAKDDRFYGLGTSVNLLGESLERPQLFLDLDWSREDNRNALYRLDSFALVARLEVPFSLLSPTLSFAHTRYSLGFQQNFTKFTSSRFHDSNNAMVGGFETDLQVTRPVSFQFGYSHDRTTVEASIASGFTSTFFVGAKWNIIKETSCVLRLNVGDGTATELGVETQW